MEQRRTRRFKLQLPLSVTRQGADRIPLDDQNPGFQIAATLERYEFVRPAS